MNYLDFYFHSHIFPTVFPFSSASYSNTPTTLFMDAIFPSDLELNNTDPLSIGCDYCNVQFHIPSNLSSLLASLR